MQKQLTLNKEINFSGKGLHTGLKVDMFIFPAPDNHGIKFQRIDMENEPIIEAIADYVTDTSRGTTIEKEGASVSTIEHIMAALWALGIDNALIKINAAEVPILDGSSLQYVEKINEVGLKEQEEDRIYYEVKEKQSFASEDKEILIYPDKEFSASVSIDFNSKVLNSQFANVSSLSQFVEEIAPCRTFVFFHELEFLYKNNLIKGGDLENAIVIVENPVPQEELDNIAKLFNKPTVERIPEGYLNNLSLRFINEPARHKLLDLIGDLALIGYRIKGRILAHKPGHKINTDTAKHIRRIIRREMLRPSAPDYDPNAEPLFDTVAIMKMLPHRPPFLLVDKIISRTNDTVIGLKNVTMNEPFFVGHFPGEPVMPGVLLVEAMAQVGGILVLGNVDEPEKYSTYFLKVDKVKFKRKVLPGDTLLFKVTLTESIRRGIVVMTGQIFVGDTLVAEGELTAQVIKNKE